MVMSLSMADIVKLKIDDKLINPYKNLINILSSKNLINILSYAFCELHSKDRSLFVLFFSTGLCSTWYRPTTCLQKVRSPCILGIEPMKSWYRCSQAQWSNIAG